MAAQRSALERKLAWNKRLLQDGNIEQADYRVERARIEAEPAQLDPVPTVGVNMEEAAALVADLGRLCAQAAPVDRRGLASLVFDAIYCDTDARRVVAV